MSVVRVKEGVTFPATVGTYKGSIAPGGFRILSAIDQTARALGVDLTITSGSDGCHSGELDPHHKAEAYDVRTHDLTDDMKVKVLASIKDKLGDLEFFTFIESPGTPNEHIHSQVRKGTEFPVTNAGDVQEAAVDEN